MKRTSSGLGWGLGLCLFSACGGDEPRRAEQEGPDAEPPATGGTSGDEAQTEGGANSTENDGGSRAGPDAGVSPAVADDGGTLNECMPACPGGDVRCDRDRVQRCERTQAGCEEWVVIEDCAAVESTCVQTDSDATCEAAPPTCRDGILNQDEVEVDCGGKTCAPCMNCLDDGQCEEGECRAGRCVPTAEACNPAAEPIYASGHSLAWPLLSADEDRARPAIGNSFGEFQAYQPDPPYIHTGVDIRGLEGDHVRNVANGNIWRPANFAECDEGGGSACRLYVIADDGRYIYYYSHLRFMDADPLSAELRARVLNALSDDYEIQPGTEVSEGERIADIADFFDNEWAHLHFSILDTREAYDGINPLLALDAESEDIFDDEPPTIRQVLIGGEDLGIVADLSADHVPEVDCTVRTGAITVDAEIKDSYFTNSSRVLDLPGSIDSIGIASARTLFRSLSSGELWEVPWYSFDQAPFLCTGPNKGNSCAEPLTKEGFYALSVDHPNLSGSPDLGTPYAPLLWDADASSSDYSGVERYVHHLTNSFGESGALDATEFADAPHGGVFQVSVEATDIAGNRAVVSTFTSFVGESGQADVTGHIAIRDSATDPGAVPSSLGNQAVAASPDIIVVPRGTSVKVATEPSTELLSADGTYDVYVRVRNLGCASVSGIRVRLSSFKTDLVLSVASQRMLTGGDYVSDGTHPTGLTLGPAAVGLLGPFPWEPTATEVEAGSAAILAELSTESETAQDPIVDGRLSLSAVSNDRLLAVRNVVPVGTDLAVQFGAGRADAACLGLEIYTPALEGGEPLEVSLDDADVLQFWGGGKGIRLIGGTLTFERGRTVTPSYPWSAGTAVSGSLGFAGSGMARVRLMSGQEPIGELSFE